jgi:hypothetical protein
VLLSLPLLLAVAGCGAGAEASEQTEQVAEASHGGTATITYHQTGACNGYQDTVFCPEGGCFISAGPHEAFVVFGIESIDNTKGTVAFKFDPTRLFVKQTIMKKTVDQFAGGDTEFNGNILGPFGAVATTVKAKEDLNPVHFAVSAQTEVAVHTSTTNGAVGANETSYLLHYKAQSGDPAITLVKSNKSDTSFPETEDCKTIALF